MVKPPGLFERLFGRFKINFTVNTNPGRTFKPGLHVQTTVQRHETFRIRDATTGEMKEYHSLEEVPEEYREQIRREMTDGHVSCSEQITSVGPDGVRRTYRSLEEVPPDIRALIERAKQTPDKE